MLYGTAHDDLNGFGTGLRGLSSLSFPSVPSGATTLAPPSLSQPSIVSVTMDPSTNFLVFSLSDGSVSNLNIPPGTLLLDWSFFVGQMGPSWAIDTAIVAQNNNLPSYVIAKDIRIPSQAQYGWNPGGAWPSGLTAGGTGTSMIAPQPIQPITPSQPMPQPIVVAMPVNASPQLVNFQTLLNTYVQAGIDPSGTSYIIFNNIPYTDGPTLLNYLSSIYFDPNAAYTYDATRSYVNPNATVNNANGASNTPLNAAAGILYSQLYNVPPTKTIADIIGTLRNNFLTVYAGTPLAGLTLPFTAYVPPPAPVITPVAPVTTAPVAPAIPSGYTILTKMFLSGLPLPLYGQASPSGVQWNLTVPFTMFVTGYDNAFMPDTTISGNSLNMNLTKLQAGLYAYKNTDLGQIIGMNWRTYELSSLDIFDLATQTPFGTFYITAEGGGGGDWLAQFAPDILRAITDVGTMGTAEIVDATDPKLAQKVNLIVGGMSLAVISTVATGGALGATIPSIAVASAGAATASAVQASTTNNAASVVTGALISGAAAGAGAALVSAVTAPATTAPVEAAGVPADTSTVAPTTVTDASGNTSLLQGSDSITMTAPQDASGATDVASGLTAAPASAPTGAVSSSTGLLSTVAGKTAAAVSTAATALETTAVAAVIQKATGKSPQPTAAAPSRTATQTLPTAPSANTSQLALLAVGALALFSGKKS